MQEHEMVVMVWNTLMNAIEWNKKEELVADQSLNISNSTPVCWLR